MATTTNFGWTTPNDTDLVKDGAAAIRTLGSAIDTSMAELKGGTTGQILSKTSNTDMDFTWIANDQGDITAVSAGTGLSGGGTSGAVSLAIDTTTTVDVSTAQTLTNKTLTSPVLTTPSISNIDAKGDLLVGTADNTIGRLAVGTNGYILTADSAETTGMKWAAAAGGSSGLTFISRTSFTNQSSQAIDNIFTSTYDNYVVIVENFYASTSTDDFQMQMRYSGTTDTGNIYNGNSLTTDRTNTTITNTAMNDVGQYTFATVSGAGNNTQASVLTINFSNVGNTNRNARWHGTGHIGETNYGAVFFGGAAFASRTYTGILLKSSSSNISGIVSVYGLAKS